MPKPAVEKVDPFTVAPGTFIRIPGGPDEVVRAVSIVFHMANGIDIVFGEEDEVSALVEQPASRKGKAGRRTDLVVEERPTGPQEPAEAPVGPKPGETRPRASKRR